MLRIAAGPESRRGDAQDHPRTSGGHPRGEHQGRQRCARGSEPAESGSRTVGATGTRPGPLAAAPRIAVPPTGRATTGSAVNQTKLLHSRDAFRLLKALLHFNSDPERTVLPSHPPI